MCACVCVCAVTCASAMNDAFCYGDIKDFVHSCGNAIAYAVAHVDVCHLYASARLTERIGRSVNCIFWTAGDAFDWLIARRQPSSGGRSLLARFPLPDADRFGRGIYLSLPPASSDRVVVTGRSRSDDRNERALLLRRTLPQREIHP